MDELVAKFLDVGQGDSTLIVLPKGSGVLVDCAAGSGSYIVDQLVQLQVSKLELLVVTHSDLDHAGDCINVIKNFAGQTVRIAHLLDRVVVGSKQAKRRYSLFLRDMAQLLRQKTESWEPYAGKCIKFGDATVSILHPMKADLLDAVACGKPNDSSVVLKVEYAGSHILLAADVQKQGWQWMVDRDANLTADVFKFPHHGAWYDGIPSLSEVMDLVDPKVVIISVGTTNSYGHPSSKTLRMLRSRQNSVRFVCTAATSQCHSHPEAMAAQIRELLPSECRGGYSSNKERSCPCAGHVTIRISDNGVEVSPNPKQHSKVIDLFETPQCRDACL